MINSDDLAFMSAAEIKVVQENKFLECFRYALANSPFYKSLYGELGITETKINSLDDLVKLPTVSKTQMQQANWDFLCVPREMIAEFTATSGTLGSPVTIALTENDLERLAYNEYKSFLCADGSSQDIYQLLLTLDRQFMAGIAYYSGLRKLGAGIIRLGPGNPATQWDNINRLKPTALVGVPSMFLKLIDFANSHGLDLNSTTVKKAICIGENIRNQDFSLNVLGSKILSAWDIKLYGTYASTEMQTACTECSEGSGGHLQADLVLVELLDEDGNAVPDGSEGEVTITTFGVEGMPLLRYRTGDICIAHTSPCTCGRNTLRLSPVIGRKHQMIKLNGTTMYPPALFDILNGIEGITDYVIEVSTNEIGTDEVVLYIQPIHLNEDLTLKLRSALQSRLKVIPRIKYVNGDEIKDLQFAEGYRKALKFKDLRK